MGRSEGRSVAFVSLSAFVDWLAHSPQGTSLSAEMVHATLAAIVETQPVTPQPLDAAPLTWRERLWTVPDETRLGVREAAEAIGRPVSFVYRHTSIKSAGADRLPHRRLDGELVFVASELRTWLREHEEIITRGSLPFVSRRAS